MIKLKRLDFVCGVIGCMLVGASFDHMMFGVGMAFIFTAMVDPR